MRANSLISVPLTLGAVSFTVLSLVPSTVLAEPNGDDRLQILPVGTEVSGPEGSRWNRAALIATPVLASGDVDRIPSSVHQAVSRFSLTILATAAKAPRPQSERDQASRPEVERRNYRLMEVGVGYTTRVGTRLVVVDVAHAEALALGLGFFERQVLSRNQANLDKPRVIANTPTLMIFDVPAIMARDAGHRDEIMRHLIWVNPRTGKLATAIWMLWQSPNDGLQVVPEEVIRVLPAGTREKREIHVDASEFVVGIPTERAFALEGLPPGKEVNWNEPLRRLGSRVSYSAAAIGELAEALNAAMRVAVNP